MKSILIKCIHQRLVSKAAPDGKIEKKAVLEILAETYHVPKEYRHRFLNELKEQGVIVEMNCFNCTIDTDIEVLA